VARRKCLGRVGIVFDKGLNYNLVIKSCCLICLVDILFDSIELKRVCFYASKEDT
jgi:hypothetical protein